MTMEHSSGSISIEHPLNGKLLLLLRLAWWVITGLSISVFLVSISRYYNELSQVCISPPCLVMSLNLGRAILLELGGIHFEYYVIFVIAIQILIFCTNLAIGVFLYLRKSND